MSSFLFPVLCPAASCTAGPGIPASAAGIDQRSVNDVSRFKRDVRLSGDLLILQAAAHFPQGLRVPLCRLFAALPGRRPGQRRLPFIVRSMTSAGGLSGCSPNRKLSVRALPVSVLWRVSALKTVGMILNSGLLRGMVFVQLIFYRILYIMTFLLASPGTRTHDSVFIFCVSFADLFQHVLHLLHHIVRCSDGDVIPQSKHPGKELWTDGNGNGHFEMPIPEGSASCIAAHCS